jgi:type III secretory pathway component EscS
VLEEAPYSRVITPQHKVVPTQVIIKLGIIALPAPVGVLVGIGQGLKRFAAEGRYFEAKGLVVVLPIHLITVFIGMAELRFATSLLLALVAQEFRPQVGYFCSLIPADFVRRYDALQMSGASFRVRHLNVPTKKTAYLFRTHSGSIDTRQ